MARPQRATSSNLSAKPVSGSGGFFIPQYQMNSIIEGIIQILRKNFEEMIKDLKQGQTRTPPRSIFSKIKNFLWGYENPKNPWYMANRLGGLGYKSQLRRETTLHEYQIFSKWANEYNNIRQKVNEERLVLDDMIAPFLAKLEDDIRDYLRSAVQPFYLYQPSFKPETEKTSSGVAKAPADSPASDVSPQQSTGAKISPPVINPAAELPTDIISSTEDEENFSSPIAAGTEEVGKVTAPKSGKRGRGKKPPVIPPVVDPSDKSRLGNLEALGNEPGNVAGRGKRRPFGFSGKMADLETESAFFPKSVDEKILKEFQGCTMYEKTLVCLEHLRSKK